MGAGDYTERVTLSKPSGTSGYETVETNVPAAIEFMAAGGPEGLQFGAPTAQATHRIRMYYRTDVRAEWRVTDEELGRTYHVSGYGDPEHKRRELHLTCTEIQ